VEAEAVSVGVELLTDIQEILLREPGGRVSSRDLLDKLRNDGSKGWGTHNNGRPIDGKWLRDKLKEYGVKRKNVRIFGKVPKGYERAQFDDAFARYLSLPPEEVAATDEEDAGSAVGDELTLSWVCGVPDDEVALDGPSRGLAAVVDIRSRRASSRHRESRGRSAANPAQQYGANWGSW
jgi:hypothetical protein